MSDLTESDMILVGKRLYEKGLKDGMQYALDQVRENIKGAIRLAIEMNAYNHDVSQERIDEIYRAWCRENKNAALSIKE